MADEEQVLGVLYANQKPSAGIIHSQMLNHFKQPNTGFEVKVTRDFQVLRESFASAEAGSELVDVRQTVADPQRIDPWGILQVLLQRQRFESDMERRFAMILDRDALRWLKPTQHDLPIYYSYEDKYYPDFVVETDTAKYICGTGGCKRGRRMHGCEHASFADDQPGRYVLVPPPKYVFQGIADFVQQPPRIETGDTCRERGGLFNDDGVEINIFTSPTSTRTLPRAVVPLGAFGGWMSTSLSPTTTT